MLKTLGVRVYEAETWRHPTCSAVPGRHRHGRRGAETLADADPVGKRMYECFSRTWLTVVGVSANLAINGAIPVSQVFVPFDQHYQRQMMLVVRSNRPVGQSDAMRALVSSLDAEVAVFEAAPVDDLLLAGVALQRASRTLALLLGGLALAIAVLGVYGVVAYFVSRRTREFGLRLALGATRGQVVKLVVDHAIHIVLVGLVPAVLVASLGTRYLTSMVGRFLPGEIAPWVQVPILMLVAGVLAAYLPARRASRVDPNVALRCD
jgi:putative ABC transport system permease protein